MKSYRQYLKAIGRKPIKGTLRTSKKRGDVEIAYDRQVRDWVGHVHEGEPETGNVVPIKRRVVR